MPKEEGRRKKEEGRRKKEEGRRKKKEVSNLISSLGKSPGKWARARNKILSSYGSARNSRIRHYHIGGTTVWQCNIEERKEKGRKKEERRRKKKEEGRKR